MAEELKNQGNKAFTSGDFPAAVDFFTQAIALAPTNHVLYSNRSGAYASLKDYTNALADAEKCVSINGTWAKGYSRVGAALHGLRRYAEAETAYEKGLSIEPTNAQLLQGKSECVKAREAQGANAMNNIAQAFSSPNLIAQIAGNPTTAPFLLQDDFKAKIAAIQSNPGSLNEHLQDQRVLQVLMMLLQQSGQFPSDDSDAMPTDEPAPQPTPAASKPAPAPEPKVTELSPEEAEKAAAKAAALKEKEAGTAAYKKRDFTVALAHYSKAWEMDPTDITYLNNKAAVFFEMGDFQQCVNVCTEAYEKSQELRSDYQLVARTLGRLGSAYEKLDKLEDALTYYNKSMLNHRTADILKKKNDVEALIKRRKEEAYFSVELSDQEREKGNAFFKDGKFPESVTAYTEATKRNPKDARNFSNRSASYLKLNAPSEALRDAEEAIRLDPEFGKAYIRKANALIRMQKTSEAMTALDLAATKDKDGKLANEIEQVRRTVFSSSAANPNDTEADIQKRIQSDPELQEILSDPIMRSILDQARTDPRALNEHMKNPTVRNKIMKLMQAGIVR